MKQIGTKKADSFIWFFTALCIFIVSVSSYFGLTNPYLWYDEAGQFWISMGLNHYSAPFSPHGSLSDVLTSNISFNRDPGGFSVLLYLWMLISSNTVFIRILPLLFFIGGCFFLSRIAYKETNNNVFSLFVLVLPFLLPYVANKSTELRAYGMEVFGIAASVYLLMNVKNRTSLWNVLLLSIMLSFTCTSRYASIIAAFAISLRVLFLLVKENGIKRAIPFIVLYSIPLLVTVCLIYYGQMSYQNSGASKIPYAQYILSSPIVLLRPLSLSYYLLIALFFMEKRKNKQISEIATCALYVGTVFFLFSMADKFPWNEIRTMPATLLIWIAIVIEGYKLFFNKARQLRIYLTAVLFVLSMFWIILYGRLHRGDRIDSEMHEIAQVIEQENYTKLFVSLELNPSVRHFLEYGEGRELHNSKYYPNRFYLQTGPEHIISNENKGYSIVSPLEIPADFYFMNPSELTGPMTRHFILYNNYNCVYQRIE